MYRGREDQLTGVDIFRCDELANRDWRACGSQDSRCGERRHANREQIVGGNVIVINQAKVGGRQRSRLAIENSYILVYAVGRVINRSNADSQESEDGVRVIATTTSAAVVLNSEEQGGESRIIVIVGQRIKNQAARRDVDRVDALSWLNIDSI